MKKTERTLEEKVKRIEEWAKKSSVEVTNFVAGSSRLAITYTGLGIVPAKIFSSYLYVLSPNKNILFGCIDTITYHVTPYTENTSIILFSEKGVENSIVRLMDASYYTGNKLLIVSPSPADYIRKRLRNTSLIEVPGANTILAETLLAVQAGYNIALKYKQENDRELRFNRLRVEVADFSSIISELQSIYSLELKSLGESLEEINGIIHTPTMEPVAYMLQVVIAEKTRRIIPVIDVTRAIKVIGERLVENQFYVLLSTSVEEYSTRELLFKARLNRIRVEELKVKTDPLTAPVYGLLLVEMLKTSNI